MVVVAEAVPDAPSAEELDLHEKLSALRIQQEQALGETDTDIDLQHLRGDADAEGENLTVDKAVAVVEERLAVLQSARESGEAAPPAPYAPSLPFIYTSRLRFLLP